MRITSSQYVEFAQMQSYTDPKRSQIRVYAMADSDRLSPEERNDIEIHDPSPGARVRMHSVKLFTDGALGSWGAALLAPYSDKPYARGLMRMPEEDLNKLVREWWDKGWGVVSSIGLDRWC